MISYQVELFRSPRPHRTPWFLVCNQPVPLDAHRYQLPGKGLHKFTSTKTLDQNGTHPNTSISRSTDSFDQPVISGLKIECEGRVYDATVDVDSKVNFEDVATL